MKLLSLNFNSIPMKTFFIVVILIYALASCYLFQRGWKLLSALKPLRIAYVPLFVIVSVLPFIQFFLAKLGVAPAQGHIVYEAGNTWLVAFLYFLLQAILVDFFLIIGKLTGIRNNWIVDNRRQAKISALLISVIITTATMIYGYINYSNPQTTPLNIAVNNSTYKGKKLRIAAISDVHLGYGTDAARMTGYVNQINALKPDVIVIAGDMIDNSVVPLYDQNMQEVLNKLDAPLGVWAIPGNHEYIAGINEAEEFYKQTKIKFLRDASVELTEGIWITGRDDRHNKNRKSISELISRVPEDVVKIVLDHQPYDLQHAADTNIDLQVSGHTHLGQIWPVSLLVKQLYELPYGYEVRNKTHFYVSSGLSLWGPPFRIGTNSEVACIDLNVK